MVTTEFLQPHQNILIINIIPGKKSTLDTSPKISSQNSRPEKIRLRTPIMLPQRTNPITIRKHPTLNHKISISLDLPLPIKPGQDFRQEPFSIGKRLKLSDPDRSPIGNLDCLSNLCLEARNIVLDRAAIGASIPMHGHEIDLAAGTLLQERLEPVETHGLAFCRIRANTIGDARGAELHVARAVRGHVLLVCCDGCGDGHIGLRGGHVGFVEGHHVVCS